MDSLVNSLVGQCETKEVCRPLNPIEQLKHEETRLKARLQDVQEALKFMEENPSFAQGLNLLSKATRGY